MIKNAIAFRTQLISNLTIISGDDWGVSIELGCLMPRLTILGGSIVDRGFAINWAG